MNRNFEEEAAFVRNLAEEVIRGCISENKIIPLNLATYLVDLKLLQFSKSVSALTSDTNLSIAVITQCVNDFIGNHLWIKTLKLQVFWREKYIIRDEIKKVHHETVFKNVFPLMTELLDGNIKTVDKENVYTKIVIFIIMFAGLGNPAQQNVIKETQAALYSIFKNTEIENFLCLGKSTKEQQLIEFARLVTGIRLFNKDCKKGGEGIDDLPLILNQGVQATKERLINFKDQLDQKIDLIVTNLVHFYNLKDIKTEEKISYSNKLKKDEIEEIKSLLIYFRQLEMCLKDLIKDLDDSVIIIEELVDRLQTILLQVHNVVRYRVAIATVQVFPLFLQLSNVWVEMQEEVDILSEINNTYVELSITANLTHPILADLFSNSDNDDSGFFPVDAITENSSEFHPGITTCSFSAISDQEYLQYAGFCAWTLAFAGGLLLTGNVTIGVLFYENRFYSFSSAEAAYKWGKNPKYYIKLVLSVAKAKPELIKLLNLYNELETPEEEESEAHDEKKPSKENAEVQTEVHPVNSYINKNYTFSEWELKKRAVKLAALTRSVTKSQQTVKRSHFRQEIGVQAMLDKDKTI